MTEELTTTEENGKAFAFSFGDPEPVLDSRMTDYLGIFTDIGGKFYRPPIDKRGLAKLRGANPHHNSILHFKKNVILKYFEPSKLVSYETMQKLALDYVVFGEYYLQQFFNGFRPGVRKAVRGARLPALPMRVGTEKDKFWLLKADGDDVEFKPGEIIHVKEPSVEQGIYGEPEYYGGIQSVMLSEESTLFRRKYYINGAHMGYILLTNDANIRDDDAKKIKKQVTDSKGPGNFRSLYLNISKSSSKEPVKVIPIGDIGTRDEFERIKNITLVEILSMHRMQAGLSGVLPTENGGFGDLEKIMRVYYELEAEPLQKPFLQLNELLGKGAVSFRDPDWKGQDSM